MENIYIYGAGGVGRDLIELITAENQYNICGMVDDYNKKKEIMGVPILTLNDLRSIREKISIIISLGEPQLREKIKERITKELSNVEFVSIVSSRAFISKTAKIGKGIIIYPNSFVGSNVVIDDNCLIGANTSIGHDCEIFSNVVVTFNCSIGGKTKLKNNAYIGSGSHIRDEIEIGSNVIIGMGSIVLNNINDDSIYYNEIRKVIKKNSSERIFK